MTKDEIEKTKQEIQIELDSLQKEIDDMKEDTKPISPDVSLGRLTRLDQMQSQNIKQDSLRKAQKRFNELKYKHAIVGTPLYQP
tara:strand:+ start:68 stop:319 length:252 start_codon:yes stop_codon:yes gene_type:complete